MAKDFDSARRAAVIQDLLGALRDEPVDLLPFDEVRESLHLRHLVDRGIYEVPLDQVVGSFNRTREFNRAFLPRRAGQRERWKRIEALAKGSEGFPPVELYKVRDAYFVIDGHHRISVLRALEAPTVEAWVKEFLTPVPLSPEESIEEVVSKAGLADFLEATGLDASAEASYRTTAAGGYERLLEHIVVHRHYLGVEQQREIPWREAVSSWRDRVYQPVIEVVRQRRVLEQFPQRTETDLYLFTMDHWHLLRERYGDEQVDAQRAVHHLSRKRRRRQRQEMPWVRRKLHDLWRQWRGSSIRESEAQQESKK
ncbi:MAG: hypothetical protein AAGD01_18515 [Acidobacteriota bacterium]